MYFIKKELIPDLNRIIGIINNLSSMDLPGFRYAYNLIDDLRMKNGIENEPKKLLNKIRTGRANIERMIETNDKSMAHDAKAELHKITMLFSIKEPGESEENLILDP